MPPPGVSRRRPKPTPSREIDSACRRPPSGDCACSSTRDPRTGTRAVRPRRGNGPTRAATARSGRRGTAARRSRAASPRRRAACVRRAAAPPACRSARDLPVSRARSHRASADATRRRRRRCSRVRGSSPEGRRCSRLNDLRRGEPQPSRADAPRGDPASCASSASMVFSRSASSTTSSSCTTRSTS